MARALLGYVGRGNEQALALEVARLRQRVAALENEVAQLRERSHAELGHTDIDLELHRIAESASAALT